jgi:hypothetical protein
MRQVRKVISYACTACFLLFPTSGEAKAHYSAKHPRRSLAPRPRPRRTQTGAILEALREGARSAADIQERTRIPLGRVHSLLSYLRRRGQVRGFKDKLRPT